LREVAAGECQLGDALRQVDDDFLTILPISSRAREGERLTNNGAIQAIVAQLKEKFDLVLLDCPPLLAIAEAREIAGLADGVIMAVRWRKTADDAVRSAARLLPAHLSEYIGVVLSRVDLRKQGRYSGAASSDYTAASQSYLAEAA
jgi:polysaccharide biosynthesis transport protein